MSGANKEALIFKHLKTDIPNPKQVLFFKAKGKHIAYGGARGGGKSWAARRKAVMLCMRYPKLKALIVRRTMPELRQNHILPLMQELNGYARYKADERTFIFPNGSRLSMGYCDNDRDMMQYQGQENDVIFFEEATNLDEEWIKFISTTLRGTELKEFNRRIYYTMNPGGVSHGYFKRLFIDRNFEKEENPDDYVFIPATVKDNKVLQRENPDYEKTLMALPPAKRKAHLEGDWNIFEGAVFMEFVDDPEHYKDRINTHVIDPFDIPKQWPIWRSFDFGYSKPFSCDWWAVDYDGRLYKILELYGCVPNEPDTGVKWSPHEIFKEISRIENEHPWLKDKHIQGVADPAIWEKSQGVSIAEVAEQYSVYFEKGDHKRIPGWMQFHYRLQFDENGIPMVYIFSNCKAFIRTIPLLMYDENRPEDIDTKQEDHCADSCRYLFMANPMKPIEMKERKPKMYDPLESNNDTIDRYSFYRKY